MEFEWAAHPPPAGLLVCDGDDDVVCRIRSISLDRRHAHSLHSVLSLRGCSSARSLWISNSWAFCVTLISRISKRRNCSRRLRLQSSALSVECNKDSSGVSAVHPSWNTIHLESFREELLLLSEYSSHTSNFSVRELTPSITI